MRKGFIALWVSCLSPSLAIGNTSTLEDRLAVRVGEAVFEKLWVFSPSSTQASDGLGPLYNARSCHGCHESPSRPLASPQDWTPVPKHLVLNLGIPDSQTPRGHRPDPYYGYQIQPFAYPDGKTEAHLTLQPALQESIDLADGTQVPLTRWEVRIGLPREVALYPKTQQSLRLTPPLDGLHWLAQIPESALLEQADPDDKNGDGISGRVNQVLNPETGELSAGRFGWKAGSATLQAQSLKALNGDIGISSWLFPNPAGDCTPEQKDCIHQPHGDGERSEHLEAPRAMTDVLIRYMESLAPPKRADTTHEGEAIFMAAGCGQCHRPSWAITTPAKQVLTIWPYTDGLLHDMGPLLADGLPDGQAQGEEWRTPALWGLGSRSQSEQAAFLHDGRAASVLEAILWHGGEADQARQAVVSLDSQSRTALIDFLENL